MRLTRSEGFLTYEGKELPWAIQGPKDSMPCTMSVALPDGGLMEATTMLGMLDDTTRQHAMEGVAGEVEKLRRHVEGLREGNANLKDVNTLMLGEVEGLRAALEGEKSKLHEVTQHNEALVKQLVGEQARAKKLERDLEEHVCPQLVQVTDRQGAEAVMRAMVQQTRAGAQLAPEPSVLASLPEDTIPEEAVLPKRRGRPPKTAQPAEPKLLERTSFIAPQMENSTIDPLFQKLSEVRSRAGVPPTEAAVALEEAQHDVDKAVDMLASKPQAAPSTSPIETPAEPKILERTIDPLLGKIKEVQSRVSASVSEIASVLEGENDVDRAVEILVRRNSLRQAPKREPRDMSAGRLEGCTDLTQLLGWLSTHDPAFWTNLGVFKLDEAYATKQFTELALHPVPAHFPEAFKALLEKIKNLLVTPSAWSGKLGVCATNLRQGSQHKAMIVELVPEAEQRTLQQVMAEWPSDTYPFEETKP